MLNSSSNLYKSEWLDLVFKNRNKNYGAYVLRAESSGTLLRALFIAAPLFIMAFAGPMLYKHFKPEAKIEETGTTVVDVFSLPPPVKEVLPEKEEPMPKAEPIKEKIKMVKLPSNPVVVKDALIDPPTVKDLENAVVGPVTQAGLETKLQSVPQAGDGNGAIGSGTGAGEGPAVDNEIHDTSGVDVYPEFEGGMKAWAKFLQRNLNYPSMAQENGIQGKVFVSFVVEKDGSISNVTVLKGIGAGCDQEAMRVIKKSPKWNPGKQNGQNVRVRYNIPLSFMITQ